MTIESLVLALVGISPWLLGAVDPEWRFTISVVLGVSLILWAALLLFTRRWRSAGNGPLFCLAGLVLLSMFQLLPLPKSVASVLSPGHVRTAEYYLPAQKEQLPGETVNPLPATVMLTLSPMETRGFLVECLTLFALYSLVVNVVASSPAAFARLAWVLAINGTLISLLAFAQKLSSNPHTMYWSIPFATMVYGPFHIRNYFPFYANICIGMAIALLGAASQKRRWLLENPRSLYLLAGIAAMILAVVFSMSRGGMLAMVGALTAAGVVLLRQRRQSKSKAGQLLWAIPVIVLVGGWFGGIALENRFAQTKTNAMGEGGRLELWKGSLGLVPQFPILGTGNGTYPMTELMTRSQPSAFVTIDHAHSDYVESLIEGGIVRLGIVLALVVLITRGGLSQYRRYTGRTLGWLILGGLIGFWAVALHSLVDFGMHVASIAMPITVVVAFVLTVRQSGVESEWIELPLPACGLLAVLIAALGTFLIVDFYHKDQANRFANHAFIEARAPEPNLDTMTVLLTRALEHQPDQYFYRDELASCLLRSSRKAATPEKKQEYLRQAMIQARLARDTNFIFWTPQTRIGLFRDQFVNAPPALWYLERACKVAPAEPFVWYAAGKQRYDEGDKDGAWRDWKRSLALTPQHLNLIARDASSVLAPEDFVDRVLPDDADIVDRAMNRLHPDPAQAGDSRRPFLLKSLVLLERKGSERAAPDELQRGRILRELNRSDEAIAALREGIAKDFTLPILHWELALEYYERDMFAEAKKQVQIVLVRSPNDPPARELLLVVEREMLLQEP